jgi:iron complex transport system permease protein
MRITRRSAGLLAVGAVAAAALLSLAVGSQPVALADVLATLLHGSIGASAEAVVDARVPRTVIGLLVGAALGLAGAAMQGVTRNPLADPGILGVNAGAALAVVIGIHSFGLASPQDYVWFALVGAGVSAVGVYAVASLGRDGATPLKLALAGAAATAGLSSLVSGILLSSDQTMDVFRFWQVGSVGGRSWAVLGSVLPFLLVGGLLVLFSHRSLNALALGDDLARGLGRSLWRDRLIVTVGVVLLCGAATALAGPIAFVGLVVPHAVRLLGVSDHRGLLPMSVLVGAALLVLADTIGRVVLPPTEVQVGIMTALIGTPVFIWVVRRGRQVSL